MIRSSLTCAALLALLLAACGRDQPPPEALRPVHTVELRYDKAAEANRYFGSVQARHEVDQGFRVGGKVVERKVDVGQVVREGDVLAVLDATDYRLAGLSLTFTGISMGWLVANVSTATIALVDKRDHGAAIGIAQALGALATLLGISDVLQTSLGIKGIFLAVAAISALLALGLATGALPLRRMGSRP